MRKHNVTICLCICEVVLGPSRKSTLAAKGNSQLGRELPHMQAFDNRFVVESLIEPLLIGSAPLDLVFRHDLDQGLTTSFLLLRCFYCVQRYTIYDAFDAAYTGACAIGAQNVTPWSKHRMSRARTAVSRVHSTRHCKFKPCYLQEGLL